MLIRISILLMGVTAVRGVAHDIDVGKGAALAFAPNTLTAAVGDTLNFHFYSGSGPHSVVAGTFANPCQPATNAFFSGYIRGDQTGENVFVVKVNSTDPIWFYCSLGPHCLDGMVGVVNPPSDQTVSDYVANASGARASAPVTLQGGILTTMGSASGSATAVTTLTGSSTSSEPGLSAETTMPTTTTTTGRSSSTTGTASGSNSALTTTSTPSTGSVAATSTPTGAGAGQNNERSVILGLTVILGGLVALMA